MNMFKIALAGAVSFGLVIAGTAANAAPVRASGSLPGVVSVKKLAAKRTAAPAGKESNATIFSGSAEAYAVFALSFTAATIGLWQITKNNGNVTVDSPAG